MYEEVKNNLIEFFHQNADKFKDLFLRSIIANYFE